MRQGEISAKEIDMCPAKGPGMHADTGSSPKCLFFDAAHMFKLFSWNKLIQRVHIYILYILFYSNVSTVVK